MTDASDDKSKSGGPRKTFTLKSGGPGVVRQTFSRGRTKAVVVEKKRKRMVGAPGATPVVQPAAAMPEKTSVDEKVAKAKALGLSVSEYEARQKAVDTARSQSEERANKQREQEAERKKRADEEQEKLAQVKREKADAEAQAIAEAQAAAAALAVSTDENAKPVTAKPRPDKPAQAEQSGRSASDFGGRIKKKPRVDNKSQPRSRGDNNRRRGKMTISSILSDEDGQRQRSLASMRRAREREKERRLTGGSVKTNKVQREVVIPESITVQELAGRMKERARDVVKFLMSQDEMKRPEDELDADMAELVVEEFGHIVRRVAASDVEDGFIGDDDVEADMKPRPPVVTIMGHVDHGKTSLLDALRSTDVAAGEAGGITQHIGAYQVKLKSGEQVTFLDTPGHAAFSAMRLRGAHATDIVILVVAADDGVMPQTIEAINHTRAAGAPMIVAVNKMDREGANPTKVLQDLLQHEIIVEAMGGEVQTREISALKKTGLDELVEAILLQAELLELKANPDREADGIVIEAQVDKGRGPVATFLVKRGTLKTGDIVVAGKAWGKIKALSDERNQRLKTAGPSLPVVVLGLDSAPAPGEPFAVVASEAKAREITEYRTRKERDETIATPTAMASLESMMSALNEKEVDEVGLVVKADVRGSAEAIVQAVEKLGNEEVRAKVIHTGVGGITESDILLARGSNAPVIAFNVRANKQARELAEREGVEIRYYSIIYNVLDDIKAVMEGLLAPEVKETFIGYAEILEVFDISKLGKIAGCRITEGVVRRGCKVRLLRDDVVIHEGDLSTLKRFKDEVKEVNAGQECGMGFEKYHDLQKADIIECFTVKEMKREL
ncbi:Translation initiation factor 2 [hydrothermal vent metagenome]|uniref:Translation initiation factor 2 n=1 Tax=hydrothermal vent metagenome TaxID=652676 RepID=A0A3B0QZZ7_9ZZZZ